MTDLGAFWHNPGTAEKYNEKVKAGASGVWDERRLARALTAYRTGIRKTIVDLGIGPGRELGWLDKLPDIDRIIGLDYSRAMLDICLRDIPKYRHDIRLIQDDLFHPDVLRPAVQKIDTPIIFLSLINSLGNFSSTERVKVLENIRLLAKSADRFFVMLYRRTQHVKIDHVTRTPAHLVTVDPDDQRYVSEIIEYGSYDFLWTSVQEKYGQQPVFWYDRKNHDIVLHIDGKRLFISHRFSRGEIRREFRDAGWEIEKLVTGESMYMVVGKLPEGT